MLTLQHIHQSFDGKPLLQGISLSLRPGETLCLLGASGSGKSTLLRIIAGLQKPESGEVRWEGESLAGIPPHRRGFGLVFQDYALFPHLTVAENVAFGLRMQANRRVSFGRKSPAQAQLTQRVQETLALVHLSGFEKRRVTDLSGGEQQRVALARALAPSPRLLMFDEPLGALDRALKESLLAELRRILRRTQIPAIYVTHDQQEAFTLADRVALLRDGQLIQVDSPPQVFANPADGWVASFLGLGSVFRGQFLAGVWQTPLGDFFQKDFSPTPPENRPLSLLLRPHAQETPQGQVRGRVTDVVFEGEYFRVELEGAYWFLLPSAPPLGAQVFLRVEAQIL
jgi:ABC-type Fe3+/spermidine/putrescine transport system ATPase subunit